MARNGTETYYNAADKSLYYTVMPNTTAAPNPPVTPVLNGSLGGGVTYTTLAPNSTEEEVTVRPVGLAMSAEGNLVIKGQREKTHAEMGV